MIEGANVSLGGWIWMLVWVGALLMVWLIVAGDRRPGREDPIDVLRTHFARREIDEAEYRQARELLRGSGGSK